MKVDRMPSSDVPTCQLVTEFIYNYCASCSRDEIDMDKCPKRRKNLER